MLLPGFARQLSFWIAISGVVALVGWIVAEATDDDTPPYDEGAVSTAGWNLFLAGAVVFVALCLVAGVQALRRASTAGR